MHAQKHVYQTQLQRCQDPGKGNIAVIIEKNTTPEEDEFYEYPYYIPIIRFYDSRDGSFFTSKNQWFRSQNPNYKFILKDLDTQIASMHLIDLKKKVM